MRLILLGLPGAGKGTQAQAVAKRHGLLHVSTGDMFRDAAAEGTELGIQAQQYMSRGDLVPDEVTIGMLLERISMPDAEAGFLLDGFPRTIAQAQALDAALDERDEAIDAVLYIEVAEDELMSRLTGRWSCAGCGAIYHEQHQPPKQEGCCDNCGASLTQRADDQPETVKQRLDVNRESTEALAGHYDHASSLVRIDGTGEPSQVTARLFEALDRVPATAQKA